MLIVKLQILRERLLGLFDKHIPNKKFKITKAKAPWLNDNIKNLIRQKQGKSRFKRQAEYN